MIPKTMQSGDEINEITQWLIEQLASYEPVIHYVQLLLVWEKPFHSTVFVAVLHLVFLYFKIWSSHSIAMIATITLVVLWVDIWKHKIWPEIRAREPDPDEDPWGELHPRVLNFPEICKLISTSYFNLKYACSAVYHCRKETPGKFLCIVCGVCIMTIFVGGRIPGALLAYIIMLCCLLGPVVWYQRLLERAYTGMEPFLMQLQYSLKPRGKNTKGAKSPHVIKTVEEGGIEIYSDSSDDDFEDIMKPPMNAVTAEVLARAIADDDELSESDESLLANEIPGFLKPQMKLESSRMDE